jgi:hypothetical protein
LPANNAHERELKTVGEFFRDNFMRKENIRVIRGQKILFLTVANSRAAQ